MATIKDVWSSNLDEEMKYIRENIVSEFPYVAMDTEFPGIIARPIGNFKTSQDYHYQTLRCNVDLLHLIQLGLTFTDAEGNPPPGTCTWQFNFRFNLQTDMYANDSIELLQKSGINFSKLNTHGIDPAYFGELLICSGLVLLDEVKWISFHSSYDFSYLIKLLSGYDQLEQNQKLLSKHQQEGLAESEQEFLSLLKLWFPCIYDIKYMMRSCKTLKGGLQDVADELKVQRVGQQHQAGSDSHLTAQTFFKMKQVFFDNQIRDEQYLGQLYGLGQQQSYVPDGTSATAETASSRHIHNLITETFDPNGKDGILGVVGLSTANQAAMSGIASRY